jgi:hypothetical protein
VPSSFGFELVPSMSAGEHCTSASGVPNTSESELEPHSSEFVGERCTSGLGRSKFEPVGDNFAEVAGKSVAEAADKIVASGAGHIRHSFVVLPTIVVAVGVGNSSVGCIVLAGPVGGTSVAGSFAVVVADNCTIAVVVFEVGHIRHNFVGHRRILHKIVAVVRNAAGVVVAGNCSSVVRILQSCLHSSVGDHPTTAAVAVAHSCCRHSSVGVLLHNRRHSSVGRPTTVVVAVGAVNNSVDCIALVALVGGTIGSSVVAEVVDKCTIAADVVVGNIHRRTMKPEENSWRSLVELERSHRRTVPMAHSPTQEGPTESALLAKLVRSH